METQYGPKPPATVELIEGRMRYKFRCPVCGFTGYKWDFNEPWECDHKAESWPKEKHEIRAGLE